MTAPLHDLAAWYDANDAYLAAAIDWLRLLLPHQAPSSPRVVPTESLPTPPPLPPAEPPEPPAAPWWKFRRSGATERPPEVSTKPHLALPPGSSESAQQAINAARERMVAAESSDPPPALTALARRLGLSSFERDLLLLCVAIELDTRIGALCARAQDDPSLPFPTFGLGFTLFDAPGWDARSPDHPLRYWRLIELNQPWGHPLTTSALRADERIVNHVKGLSHLDDRLVSFLAPLGEPVDEQTLPASHRQHVEDILTALGRDHPDLRPIQLLGRDAESRQTVAGAVGRRLGLTVYRLQADILPSAPGDLETLARLWQRETLLLPVALYVDASEVDRVAEPQAAALRRFLGRCGGLVFVQAREAWPISQGSNWFDVDKPTPMEQRAHWRAALSDDHDETAAELAAQFSLNTPAITRIVAAASEDDGTPLPKRLWARAAQHTRLRIDALAQRIDAKATWDDIVLPAPETALLRQIVAHVEGRGKVYDEWGFRERMNRGLRHQRPVRRRQRHRQDDGGRSHRQRPRTEPLPDRPVSGGEQVHRRDREEPAAAVRRRGRRRRHPVLRRGRRAVRQAHRGATTAKTATPTSRSTTCCSGMESYRGLAILATNMKMRARPGLSPAAARSSSTSRFPARRSGGRSGSAPSRGGRRPRASTSTGWRSSRWPAAACTTSRCRPRSSPPSEARR